MRPVDRSEILDFATYAERRQELRPAAIRARALRRVHVGAHLTFLFENHDTVRHQVQELTLAERTVKEADLRREVDTWNALLGGEGELGCTLLVEVEDPAERMETLSAWRELPAHLYVRLEDGSRIQAVCVPARGPGGRLAAVQYLKFPVGGRVPVAVGCDLPGAAGETPLPAEQREALADDLA